MSAQPPQLDSSERSGWDWKSAALTLTLDRSVAVGAVYGSPVSRLEWYLAFFATGSAYGIVHLPLLPVTSVTIPTIALLFFSCPAVGAAPGLVGEALTGIEFLLASGESKFSTAIRAN
jgi:hypothetical protein